MRRKTWPLAGFMTGLLLTPPPPHSDGPETLLVGAMAGLILAAGAFVAAVLVHKDRPTKTYLPWSDRPGLDLAFAFATVATLWLKGSGFWGLAPLGVGMIPVAIVLYGGSHPLRPTKAQMVARLREIADDPAAPSEEREQARSRLQALK